MSTTPTRDDLDLLRQHRPVGRIDVYRIATITTPNADWNGSETITFTATDPGALSDSNAATFTVTAINDAPVVSDIPEPDGR